MDVLQWPTKIIQWVLVTREVFFRRVVQERTPRDSTRIYPIPTSRIYKGRPPGAGTVL